MRKLNLNESSSIDSSSSVKVLEVHVNTGLLVKQYNLQRCPTRTEFRSNDYTGWQQLELQCNKPKTSFDITPEQMKSTGSSGISGFYCDVAMLNGSSEFFNQGEVHKHRRIYSADALGVTSVDISVEADWVLLRLDSIHSKFTVSYKGQHVITIARKSQIPLLLLSLSGEKCKSIEIDASKDPIVVDDLEFIAKAPYLYYVGERDLPTSSLKRLATNGKPSQIKGRLQEAILCERFLIALRLLKYYKSGVLTLDDIIEITGITKAVLYDLAKENNYL